MFISILRRAALFGIAAALFTLTAYAAGITLSITPAGPYEDTNGPCGNVNGNWPGCGTRAFISNTVATADSVYLSQSTFGTQPLPAGTLDYSSSFESWKTAGGYLDWHLTSGTISGDLALTVDKFEAIAYTNVGGLGPNPTGGIEISFTYTPGVGDPTRAQLFWTQGLLINYQPGLPDNGSYNTATVFNTLDTSSFSNLTGCLAIPNPDDGSVPNVGAGQKYCDPFYPYQYADKKFYDAPLGPYPNASFRGIALLSSLTSGPDGVETLTVYGGVNYGFDVYVTPEPGTWVLISGALLVVAASRRRFRR